LLNLATQRITQGFCLILRHLNGTLQALRQQGSPRLKRQPNGNRKGVKYSAQIANMELAHAGKESRDSGTEHRNRGKSRD